MRIILAAALATTACGGGKTVATDGAARDAAVDVGAPDAAVPEPCSQSVAHYYAVGCTYTPPESPFGIDQPSALAKCNGYLSEPGQRFITCEQKIYTFLDCTQNVQPFDPSTTNGCAPCIDDEAAVDGC